MNLERLNLNESLSATESAEHPARGLFHEAYESASKLISHPSEHLPEIAAGAAMLALLLASRARIASLLTPAAEAAGLEGRSTILSAQLDRIGDDTATLVRRSHANISTMLGVEPIASAFRTRMDDIEGGMSVKFYHQYWEGDAAMTAESVQEQSAKTLNDMMTDNAKSVNFSASRYRGPSDGSLLGQATFAVAPIDQPLATNHLVTCAGLVVQNEKAGLHYLAHLDVGVTAEQIAASLKSFPLSDANVYLLPGPAPSPVWDHVLRTITDLKGTSSNTWLVRPDRGTETGSIISHVGKIFNGRNVSMQNWQAFKLAPVEDLMESMTDPLLSAAM